MKIDFLAHDLMKDYLHKIIVIHNNYSLVPLFLIFSSKLKCFKLFLLLLEVAIVPDGYGTYGELLSIYWILIL